jgi:hypothetical protein
MKPWGRRGRWVASCELRTWMGEGEESTHRGCGASARGPWCFGWSPVGAADCLQERCAGWRKRSQAHSEMETTGSGMMMKRIGAENGDHRFRFGRFFSAKTTHHVRIVCVTFLGQIKISYRVLHVRL